MRRLTILIIAVLGQGCGDFDLPHRSNGSKAPSVIPGQDDTRKIVVNGGEEPDPGTAQDGGGGAPPPPTDGGVGPAPTTPDSKPAPTPKQDSGGGSTGVCGNAFESEVFTLVNQERQKAGKQPFKCDALAGKAARDYSQVMCDKNHFSHTGPDGSSPFDRMEKAGISFQTAGENIAAGLPRHEALGTRRQGTE